VAIASDVVKSTKSESAGPEPMFDIKSLGFESELGLHVGPNFGTRPDPTYGNCDPTR